LKNGQGQRPVFPAVRPPRRMISKVEGSEINKLEKGGTSTEEKKAVIEDKCGSAKKKTNFEVEE